MTKFTREQEAIAAVLGFIGCVIIAASIILGAFSNALSGIGAFLIGFALVLPVLRILYEQEP